MPSISLDIGDEIVVLRRRRVMRKDNDGQDIVEVENTELSAVRIPQPITLFSGGSLAPEYAADPENPNRDRQFLVARWPCRL